MNNLMPAAFKCWARPFAPFEPQTLARGFFIGTRLYWGDCPYEPACCGVYLPSVSGVLRRLVSSNRVGHYSSTSRHPAWAGYTRLSTDGYRIIARKDGNRVTLWSRYGTNFTDRLPMVAEAIYSLAAESALVDGEAVVFRPDGHSDFAALRTERSAISAHENRPGRRQVVLR
jgi:ATP dependent DNA ligase domain